VCQVHLSRGAGKMIWKSKCKFFTTSVYVHMHTSIHCLELSELPSKYIFFLDPVVDKTVGELHPDDDAEKRH